MFIVLDELTPLLESWKFWGSKYEYCLIDLDLSNSLTHVFVIILNIRMLDRLFACLLLFNLHLHNQDSRLLSDFLQPFLRESERELRDGLVHNACGWEKNNRHTQEGRP